LSTHIIDRPKNRFIDPKVLIRIQNMELLARTVVEGFVTGLHQSPYLGFSVDFAEFREYHPGDEIRRIDWNVYGRSDKLFVKLFEGETNTRVTIILDMSGSMNYGSGEVKKGDYAKMLASCLTYFAYHQRDAVGSDQQLSLRPKCRAERLHARQRVAQPARLHFDGREGAA